MSETTVLIVDDQEMVRAGLRMIIDAQGDLRVVGEASEGTEAIEAVARLRPDVVLMDIRMPGIDGIEATKRIMGKSDNRPKVIVLTTFDLDEYVVEAIRAGASGFLLKDAPPSLLTDGIRVVARGDALLSPSVTRRLINRYIGTDIHLGSEVSRAIGTLTEREREVLEAMAAGLSNEEIAERLYIGETTVKTHVSNVLAKLHLRDRIQAVVFAYESGIVRPGAS